MTKKSFVPQAFEEGAAPQIALDSVESNQIKAIGYNAETKTLAVTFTRGEAVYHYGDVAPETFEAFKAAESKGNYFGQHIKSLPFKKYHAEPVAA